MTARVMGLDPGSSAAGAVVFELREDGWKAVAVQAFRPQKDTRKKDARRSLQDAEVIAGISRGVVAFVREHQVRFIVAELPDAGAARYSTCRAISLATGWLVGVIEALGLAYEFYTPRDVKFAATGNHVATKTEMMRAMSAKYPIIAAIKYAADREHVADAAGVFEAARNGQTVRLLEQEAKPGIPPEVPA